MEESSFKLQLINNYLNQQIGAGLDDDRGSTISHNIGAGLGAPSVISATNTQMSGTLTKLELPDNTVMDEFKTQVRNWIELDNAVKKLQQAVRERNLMKKQLTEKILLFMAKYNIEDLNARDGSRLRYKVTQKTQPVKPTEVKARLVEHFNQVSSAEELLEKVFAPAQKVDKVVLKRLGAKPA